MPAPHGLSLEDEIAVIWMTTFGAGAGEIAAYLGVSEAVARGIIRRLAASETLMRAALEVAQEANKRRGGPDGPTGTDQTRRGGPDGPTGTQENPASLPKPPDLIRGDRDQQEPKPPRRLAPYAGKP